MLTKEELKIDLERIKKNDFKPDSAARMPEYTEAMLQWIGDPDPELRDDLIYEAFDAWIRRMEVYGGEELRRMLDILMDENHLFYRIGNEGDDSVFTRTFSILAVVLILIRHRKAPLLDKDGFLEAKSKILAYYSGEKDLRGYLDRSGWAHGAAHGADALDELVQCRECGKETLKEILESIQTVLYNGRYLLCNEEDERIARVVYRMIRMHPFSSPLIGKWLNRLDQCCQWERTRSQYIARVNTKNFIRCLYFKLAHYKTAANFTDPLLKVEERLNRFVAIDKMI